MQFPPRLNEAAIACFGADFLALGASKLDASRSRMTEPVGVANRVVVVLQAMAYGEPVKSLKTIASQCGLPPSTVHRLLEQLVQFGLVARASQRRYRIGGEFACVGALAVNKIARVARPVLRDLARRFGGVCVLSLYSASLGEQVAIASVGERPEGPVVSLNEPRSLLANMGGLAILAHLGRHERDPIADGVIEPEALTDIALKGYGAKPSTAAVEVSAAVFDKDSVVGSISVFVRPSEWTPTSEQRIAAYLLSQCSRLSVELGSTRERRPSATNAQSRRCSVQRPNAGALAPEDHGNDIAQGKHGPWQRSSHGSH
jgi:DNA-binding IclR family transcriptional regulator